MAETFDVMSSGAAKTALTELRNKLDSYQRDVAAWRPTEGNMRVVACAGSGKTTTMVCLLANILEAGVPPERIIATTFTKKAGQELEDRLAKVTTALQRGQMRVGTNHALFGRWLRNLDPKRWAVGLNCDGSKKYRDAGVPPSDSLWRAALSADPIELLRGRKGLGIDDKSKLKEAMKEVPLAVDALARSNDYRLSDPKAKKVLEGSGQKYSALYYDAWVLYEAQKQAAGCYDFADVLSGFYDVAKTLPGGYTVLEDEAQDCSRIQTLIAVELAKNDGRVVLIGDVRQSIYQWRGAAPDLFLHADKHIDAKRTIFLPTNYRSCSKIVEVGNRVAAGRDWTLGPAAVAARTCESGGVVTITGHEDVAQMTKATSIAIRDMVDQKRFPPEEIAILCRTKAVQGIYESSLILRNVPVLIVGGSSFFNSEVWKAFSALLISIAGKPSSSEVYDAVKAQAGLGDSTAKVVQSAYRGDMLDALRSAQSYTRRDNIKQALAKLSDLVSEAQELYRAAPADKQAEAYVEVCNLIAAHYALPADKKGVTVEQGDNDDNAAYQNAALIAARYGSVKAVLAFADKCRGKTQVIENEEAATEKVVKGKQCVTVSTIHKCVHPDTLVESEGLQPISMIPDKGRIAAPSGVVTYREKVELAEAPALKLTTTSGYTLTTSLPHGMTTWNGAEFVRAEAQKLKVGDWLRVRLGCTSDAPEAPSLPGLPQGDVRAVQYHAPEKLTVELAELFGLIVADGTVFRAGFRVVKRYASVVTRFAELVKAAFGADAQPHLVGTGTPMMEVCSHQLASWLLSIGGTAPNAKYVPDCILRAPLHMQAAFLRGLFEDGTVNEEGGHVDHIHFENVTLKVAETVQTMLLRFGIISSVRDRGGIATLYIYSQHAKRFAERISFISPEKNARLQGTFGNNTRHLLPVTKSEVSSLRKWTTQFEHQNGRLRGTISRDVAGRILARAAAGGVELPFLQERLGWHHERIKSIKKTKCKTMCVEVPDGSRFLQNGFDGWNSKGLEWKVVFADATLNQFPHIRSMEDAARREEEARLFYVCVTRARDELHLTYCEVNNGRPAGPSQFIDYVEFDDGDEGVRAAESPALPATTQTAITTYEPEIPVAVPVPSPRTFEVMTGGRQDVEDGTSARSDRIGKAVELLEAAYKRAEVDAGSDEAVGARGVVVTRSAMNTLLDPFGFAEDAALARGQRVWASTRLMPGIKALVYSSIPVNSEDSRGLGDDSIKLVFLNASTGKPMLKKQPIVARTKGWRLSILKRFAEMLHKVA